MDREVQAAQEARVVLRLVHLVVTTPLMDHPRTHLLQVALVVLVAPAARVDLVDREAPEALARRPSP